MAGPIENKDLFSSDIFSKTIQDAKALILEMDKLESKIVDVAKVQKEILNQQDNKTIDSVKRTKSAVDTLNEAEKIAIKIRKEKESISQKLVIAESKEAKEIAKLNQQLITQRKINRDLAKEQEGLGKSYSAQSARLNRLRNSYKDLAVQNKGNTKEAKALLVQITSLDTTLKKVDATVGQHQRSVGNYGKALNGLGGIFRGGLGILGFTAGLAGIGMVVRNITGIFVGFEKANSNLKAVMSSSFETTEDLDKAMEKLKKQAKELGAVTAFTASEVTGLQISLAKLGFPTDDIQLMTASTLDAAAAMGSGLDETATLTGATLRSFNLSANQAARVNDVLAKATSASALDFEKLSSSMSTIAPVANSFGFSLEGTTALLGQLSNAGFDASSAATATRNILLNLADSNGKLAKSLKQPVKDLPSLVAGLKQLKSEGIDLGEALELTDVRSVAAFSTFLEGADDVLVLNDALEKAQGTAKEMAEIQLDNLAGSVTKLGSAWEGLVLSVESGEGAISKGLRSFVDGVTKLLGVLTKANLTYKDIVSNVREQSLSENAKEDVKEFEKFLQVTKQTNQSLEERKATIERFLKVDTVRFNQLREELKLVQAFGGKNRSLSKEKQQEILILGTRIKAIRALGVEVKNETDATNENTGSKGNNAKATRELTGLIEKQAKVVSDLNKQIQEAKTEDLILELSIKLDVQEEELNRLKRIVSSSFEEIDKIEQDLIADQTERRIAQEIEKSEKLIAQIESNSRIEESKKKELIEAENRRLELFVNEQEVKSGQERIKNAEELSKAEFEQRRTGFKNEKEYEEEKAKQFEAIRRNSIEAEIKLLEQFGGEGSSLRIEKLKAELEGLYDIGDGFKEMEDLIGAALNAIADMIDETFEKRIEKIGEAIDKTGERVDFLRSKAANGQLAAEESLAFEQKKEAELEQQRERARKRQERTQALFTVLNTYQANVSSGAANPLAKTFSDIAVLKGLAGTLAGFYEGADDVGKSLGKPQLPGRDGHIVRVDGKEQIWSDKDRKAVGYRNRDEIKKIVSMHDSGLMQDMINNDHGNSFMGMGAFALNGMMSQKEVVNHLKEVNRSINNIKIPEGTVSIDSVMEHLKYTLKIGNTKTTQISKLHGKR